MGPPVADAQFARWLAASAGEALAGVRAELGFEDPVALLAGGRKIARDVVLSALARWRPADAVLTPEHGTIPARLAHRSVAGRAGLERVWIVDPLDGRDEFAAAGGTDWAVHVALWSSAGSQDGGQDGGLVAGAVAQPARHRVLGTDHPPPYPPLSLAAATGGPIRIAVGTGAPTAALTAAARRLRARFVPIGGIGAGIAAVITGEVDVYAQPGPGYEWETAAPVAVALTTGLYASRTDGSTLSYNQADPRLPDLLVCRKDLAARVLAALRAVDQV